MALGWPEHLSELKWEAVLKSGCACETPLALPRPFFTSQLNPGTDFDIMAPVTRCPAARPGCGSGGKGSQPTPPAPPPLEERSEVLSCTTAQHFLFQNHR